MLANDQARFFSSKRRSGTVYYGCRYRTNRRIRLATATGGCNDPAASIEQPRLAGRYVAFVPVFEGCTEGQFESVVRVDLATRKRQEIEPPLGAPMGTVFDSVDIESLELGSDGTVAWIAASEPGEPNPDFGRQVGALRARDSRPVTLDTGAGIEKGSLGLSAARIYWTKDGVTSSFSVR